MNDLTPQERLQPFLLDRITDEQPQTRLESRERRVMSPRDFRRALLRDLAWLLNCPNHPPGDGLDQYPEVARSVLNYGMPELAGATASGLTPQAIERMVRNAVLAYEPRVLRESLEVTAVSRTDSGGTNLVQIEIRGEAWNLPMPESLYIRTEVDLETGRCMLRDPAQGG